MKLDVSDFLDSRIEAIIQNLRKTNSEYALAAEKSKSLYENIETIVKCEKDMRISAGDCMDFREFFDHSFTQTAIMQQELYRQGYLDCVKLLCMIGML